MFPSPSSKEISPEQALVLDDSFYSSNPMAYFQSRVDSLITWSAGPTVDYTTGLGYELLTLLRLPGEAAGQTDDQVRSMQIASDAFSLRHHIAECTIRLFAALIRKGEGDSRHAALWAEIAEDRDDGAKLFKRITNFFEPDDVTGRFPKMIVPAALLDQHAGSPELARSLEVLAAWLWHAGSLLVDDRLDVNAANNKAKHGLAVRPRDDTRLTLTTVPPDDHGNVQLSALDGPHALNIFDSPFLESLSAPPSKVKAQTRGMELNWIKLHTPTLLAEATMISVVHGALFHVAASQHFADRTDLTPPSFPTLPLGPTPDELLTETVSGLRLPVTFPEGANQHGRKAAVIFRQFDLPMSFTTVARNGKVVEG